LFVVDVLHDLLQGFLGEFREGGLEMGQFLTSVPCVLVWCAHDLEYPENLVNLTVSPEQRLFLYQLSKDTPHRPYIHP
jgi:hypothetical protein